MTRGNVPRGHTEASDAIKKFVVEKVAEKIQQKANAHAAKITKLDPAAREALAFWTRPAPGARRARFTREEIAAAALQIADAEGIDAVSMRRLAADLGAGTMTLYHYVRTKDELMALVNDAIMAELIVPPEAFPADWRSAMTMIANRSREALQRHPCAFDITDDPAVGPNGVRHFDQSLQAVSSLAITLGQRLDIIAAVDEYVFGYCMMSRNPYVDADDAAQAEQIMNYMTLLVSSGDYPELAAMIADHGASGLWREFFDHARDTTRFDRNLARLLDGIERDLPRRRRRASLGVDA